MHTKRLLRTTALILATTAAALRAAATLTARAALSREPHEQTLCDEEFGRLIAQLDPGRQAP